MRLSHVMTFQTKILLLVLVSCCVLGAPTGLTVMKQFHDILNIFNDSYHEMLYTGTDNLAKAEGQTAAGGGEKAGGGPA